jgi:hypothetical protein
VREDDMGKNLQAKTRKVNEPYEVYVNEAAGFEWRILKHYQSPEKEAANPYARTFCAVKGPGTWDGYDMGDTYIKDYVTYGRRIPDRELTEHLSSNPWRVY